MSFLPYWPVTSLSSVDGLRRAYESAQYMYRASDRELADLIVDSSLFSFESWMMYLRGDISSTLSLSLT